MKIIPITENHLFAKAYGKGKKYSGKYIAVYVLRDLHANRLKKENPQKLRVNRVGITVTKKLCGAVGRSRCRRIIREAYRELDRDNAIRKGYLVVIAAKSAATSAKTQDITADLKKAFNLLDMFFDQAKKEENAQKVDKCKNEATVPSKSGTEELKL